MQGKSGGSGAPQAQGHMIPPRLAAGPRAQASLDLLLAVGGDKAFLPGGGGRGSDTRTGSRRSSAGRWHGLPETPFSWTQTQTAPHPAEEAGTEPGAKPRLRADLRRALHVPRGLSFSFCREQVDAAQRSVAWQ